METMLAGAVLTGVPAVKCTYREVYLMLDVPTVKCS